METKYVRCNTNINFEDGFTVGKIYELIKDDEYSPTVRSNSGENIYICGGFQSPIIRGCTFTKIQEEMTNEQKLQELEKQLAALKEAIKEENEIKMGDYFVIKSKPGLWDSSVGGENPLYTLKFPYIGKVVKIGEEQINISNKSNPYIAMFDGKYGWALNVLKNNNLIRKANKEEIEKYESSKRERIYKLSSGYEIKITKEGIFDEENVKYLLKEIQALVPTEHRKAGGRNITVVDYKLHFGCTMGQNVSLSEIKDIIKIAEELQK